MTLGGSARRIRVSLVLACAVSAAASDACTPFDAAASPVDGTAGVTGSDAGDASLDADGGSRLPADAGDATPAPAMNVARLGTARASSVGLYPAALVIDADPKTSWYAVSGSCPLDLASSAYVCAGDTTYVEVVLDTPRIVERVKISGNRDAFASGYDVLTGRILLLDGDGASMYDADLTTTRGAEPNGDADHAVTPPVANVKVVRFVVRTAESSGPGIGELEVLGR